MMRTLDEPATPSNYSICIGFPFSFWDACMSAEWSDRQEFAVLDSSKQDFDNTAIDEAKGGDTIVLHHFCGRASVVKAVMRNYRHLLDFACESIP